MRSQQVDDEGDNSWTELWLDLPLYLAAVFTCLLLPEHCSQFSQQEKSFYTNSPLLAEKPVDSAGAVLRHSQAWPALAR